MDFELYAVLSQDVPLQQKFLPSVDKPKTFSINQQPEGKKRSISLPLLCMFINVHPFRGRHRVVKKAGPCTGEPNSRYGGRVILGTLRLATTDYQRLDGRLLGLGRDKGFSPEPPSWL